MYPLILKIVTSHLLGDFVFQSNKMVKDIAHKKYKSKYLYLHAIIHFFLILIFLGFKKQYIFPALLLSITHLVIDMFTKIHLKKKINSFLNLIIDQSLHAVSIAVFIYYFYNYKIDYEILFSLKNQMLFISLIALTFVSSISIKKIMEAFNYQIVTSGIQDAGKYIGMLERAFVFLFVITNFWEGIGFLLAAKSIFRFGDLKDKNDIKLTEYILIGTLLSFGLAILIGEIYLKISTIK